ncbi:hypothetical protein [Syntrophobacter fumaroxidans]|uniref:hypothetical protein n=1 Tax=Syntrophobacter fumaroxidans TaxID=119484 RepID=UPI00031B55AB|nr:hypothetical protein [Syntrophobacter fumaroxidans]HOI95069.1 hypothetical protein [Syntrophobacter fumaroxidans]
MEQCKECDLAIYCYSDSSTWIFRTKQEMEEKKAAISECPVREQVEQLRLQEKRKCSGVGAG